jgi:hypothetical protein
MATKTTGDGDARYWPARNFKAQDSAASGFESSRGSVKPQATYLHAILIVCSIYSLLPPAGGMINIGNLGLGLG